MPVRWLSLALATLALLIGGCGGSDDSTSTAASKGDSTKIEGPWAGQLTQAGLPPFKVAVVIFSGAAKVVYTGIDCAGDWKLTGGGGASGTYTFRETINRGAGGECKGTGTVHLDQFAAKRLRYSFDGGGVTSHGVMRPARTSELAAIFREAGVGGTTFSVHCPKGTTPVCSATATAR